MLEDGVLVMFMSISKILACFETSIEVNSSYLIQLYNRLLAAGI